jgi:hypothetical protein
MLSKHNLTTLAVLALAVIAALFVADRLIRAAAPPTDGINTAFSVKAFKTAPVSHGVDVSRGRREAATSSLLRTVAMFCRLFLTALSLSGGTAGGRAGIKEGGQVHARVAPVGTALDRSSSVQGVPESLIEGDLNSAHKMRMTWGKGAVPRAPSERPSFGRSHTGSGKGNAGDEAAGELTSERIARMARPRPLPCMERWLGTEDT